MDANSIKLAHIQRKTWLAYAIYGQWERNENLRKLNFRKYMRRIRDLFNDQLAPDARKKALPTIIAARIMRHGGDFINPDTLL